MALLDRDAPSDYSMAEQKTKQVVFLNVEEEIEDEKLVRVDEECYQFCYLVRPLLKTHKDDEEGLKTKLHPNLYKMAWVKNTTLKVQHCGFNNTYSFKEKGIDFTFRPIKDLQPLKLKHSTPSFLLKRLTSGDGILGPYPNSSESSSFQRERIDRDAILQLDRKYNIWKPKYKLNHSCSKKKKSI
ncbi:hypothetical protein M9H77_31173 [Catharanthus roseus]|uniref:Uncharacterized protein n=1 Tax=Catharanthus roseus TaxID=4058 RepID=A0ACC0A383_CATRO|nr:hypothetical protein M9H77_31173 [Catharanthus roseus]